MLCPLPTTMIPAKVEEGQWTIRMPVRDAYTIHEVQRMLGFASSSTVYAMIEREELAGPRTREHGQMISHESLAELVRVREPVARHERARLLLVEMIEERVNG